jgi:hypothetical protein
MDVKEIRGVPPRETLSGVFRVQRLPGTPFIGDKKERRQLLSFVFAFFLLFK